MEDELKRHKEEKDFYKKGLENLNTHLASSGLSYPAVRAKLEEQDPAAFRLALDDLALVGEEPEWLK